MVVQRLILQLQALQAQCPHTVMETRNYSCAGNVRSQVHCTDCGKVLLRIDEADTEDY
jgi:hypothetical protein